MDILSQSKATALPRAEGRAVEETFFLARRLDPGRAAAGFARSPSGGRPVGSREETGRVLRASGMVPILVVEGADTAPPGATGGFADLAGYAPDRLRVWTTSAGPSVLWVADAWSAGGQATVDGEPVKVLPAAWRCAPSPCPPGRMRWRCGTRRAAGRPGS